jgi:PAS domain S-box-containing protein
MTPPEDILPVYAAVFEATTDSVVVTDADWEGGGPRVIAVNPAFTRLTGYTAEQIVGRSPRVLQGNRSDRRVIERLRGTLRRGLRFQGETYNYRRDGSEFIMEWFIDPIRNSAGIITHYIGFQRDVTHLRHLEADAAASRELERTLAQFFRDAAITIIDTEGRIRNWNLDAMQLYGYSRLEAVGQPCSRLFPAESRESRHSSKTSALQTSGFYEEEGWHQRKDGTRFWAQTLCTLIRRSDGLDGCFVMVVRDRTESKKLLDERMEMDRKALESEKFRALGLLAGGVAHDFNNILGGILCNVSILKRELRPGSMDAEAAAAIEKGSRLGAELTRQILTYAQCEDYPLDPLDLDELIRESLLLLEPRITSAVSLNYSGSPGVTRVLGDKSRLQQVVLNLCANACDSLYGRGGFIALTVTSDVMPAGAGERRAVRLSVRDDGPGMDETTLTRIFEPFFTTKSRRGGTGLGLAVVQSIVSKHGGVIRVASKPGQGTCFDVFLRPAD